MLRLLLTAAALAGATAACAPPGDSDAGASAAAPGLLTVVTAEDPQTQLMALILTRASGQTGADTRVLLCGPAGDLALAEPPAQSVEPLAPRSMSPHGLLSTMLEEGVTVQVCAIYLPNSAYAQTDLMDGVTVATPPEIATIMADPHTSLFTF